MSLARFSVRRLGLTAALVLLASCQPIPAPVLSPFADQGHWVLLRPLTHRIGETGQAVLVPSGFVTDFASIPRALWQVLPPHGRYSRAAILHDYLYWDQRCTREQADRIMLIAMGDSRVKPGMRRTIFRGVRLGGKAAWDANTRDRRDGKLRITPEEHLPIPDGVTWKEYQKELIGKGVREPAFREAGRPSYCAAGDETKSDRMAG